ncbi:hypothetical protein AgCh_024871 [Apium graveolens]
MLSSLRDVLIHSIKKRTKRRCSVLQVLESKNNTSETYMLSEILEMSDENFLENFVTAHEDEIPKREIRKNLKKEKQEILWNAVSLSHYDPRTNQCEIEVQKITHLQKVANRLPDAFTDVKNVTKSHIPAINVPCKIIIPEEDNKIMLATESKARQKRGRPIGSKDKTPRKTRKLDKKVGTSNDIINLITEETSSRDYQTPEIVDNEEISINDVISA